MTAPNNPRQAEDGQAALLRAAEDLAERFRDRHGLTGAPFDARRWCRHLGVDYTERHQTEEGRYVRGPAGPSIALRRGDRGPRSTFTAAHELGHHLVDEARRDPALRATLRPSTVRALGRLPLGSPDEEPLCDVLAGALLIERTEAEAVTHGGRVDLARLLRLAEDRRMTVIAAFIRIKQVGGTQGVLASCKRASDDVWQVRNRSAGPLPLTMPATVRPLAPDEPPGPDRRFLWCGRLPRTITGQACTNGTTLWLLIESAGPPRP